MISMPFRIGAYVTGGTDHTVSRWREEEDRAAEAAESALEEQGVTANQAHIGAIAESDGYPLNDEDAPYFGVELTDLQRWANAWKFALVKATSAAGLPKTATDKGVFIMLGHR